MRRMRDEKKAVFLQVKRCDDGTFEIKPPDNITIENGMNLTLYAKPVDHNQQIARFTVGSGRVSKGNRVSLKLTQRDSRIQLNEKLQYYVRVPQRKRILRNRMVKKLLQRLSEDD